MPLNIPDFNSLEKSLSTTQDASGNLVGSTCLTDPVSGNKATVQIFHNGDGQALGSNYAVLTGAVPLIYNGVGWDRLHTAPGSTGSILISSDGVKATYRACGFALTPAATPTDVITLTGSASKTVRVKQIKLSGLATTAGQFVWQLLRRSAANTGGTSTNPTIGRHDTSDAAVSAVLAVYSANPSGLGTLVGALRYVRLFHNVSTAQPDRFIWEFCASQDKALILRGTTDIIAINGNGGTLPAGAVLDYEISWEEDAS